MVVVVVGILFMKQYECS